MYAFTHLSVAEIILSVLPFLGCFHIWFEFLDQILVVLNLVYLRLQHEYMYIKTLTFQSKKPLRLF